jgi:chromosome segregation ATPase
LAADANDVAQDVRTALKKIVAMAKEMNEMDNQAAKLDEQAKALPDTQARLRDNIKALDPASPLVKRYVEKLSAQEDQIEKLDKERADLKARIEAKRKELLEFLKDLKVGKMPQAPAGARSAAWGSGRGIF